jgi:4-carboxymuconolactone decarboxylase
MSELDARYARGQDTRRLFGGGTITSVGSVPGAWDVAPDLERILGEALFGTIWHRDALSPVQREMITLSTLIVLAREPQLRRHLGNARNVGLPPAQIVELILHDTWYGGVPAGLNALALCKAVFAERGIAFTPPRVHDPTADPDRLFERGAQLRRQYMGDQSAARPAPPTEAERAFNRITGEYYWGTT